MTWSIRHADALDALSELGDASVDALVTDPPAGIRFMGRTWDHDHGGRAGWVAAFAAIFREALRTLKPGAHGLVWALPRTSHWTACALEDGGFEVRDVLTHHFGNGFPKSLNARRAIDMHLCWRPSGHCMNRLPKDPTPAHHVCEPHPDAEKFEGWHTALRPAVEHWILVRKPIGGAVGRNVWEHGTGALNVEGCRVPPANDPTRGRWPPNLLLSHGPECEETCAPECPVAMLDAQSGERRAGPSLSGTEASSGFSGPVYGNSMGRRAWQSYGDVGGASRFFPTFPYEPRFLYMPKASTPERESGLVGMSGGARRNPHPTVKPLGLMRWLCRLVTPPGGLVLDPFAGSGSTGVAALREDFRFLGIEEDAEYVEIARSRIEEDAPLFQRMTR